MQSGNSRKRTTEKMLPRSWAHQRLPTRRMPDSGEVVEFWRFVGWKWITSSQIDLAHLIHRERAHSLCCRYRCFPATQLYLGVYTTNTSQIHWCRALAKDGGIVHVRKPTGGSNRPKAETLQGIRSTKGRACTEEVGDILTSVSLDLAMRSFFS